MLSLLRNERFLVVSLFLSGIISRLPFLEKAQSHWDGPDYTIGILHYSFIEQTPSPPGYPLYIALGKFFHLFISDPHLSILMVSVLFAGIGAVVFYIAGKLLFDRAVGLISAGIFLSAPTIYYFGISANPYGILPTTTTLISVVVFLIIKEKKDYGFLLALLFSLAIGIRPQDAMFLTPLYLLGCFYLKSKERIISIAALIFLTLFWFLPTTVAVGGIDQYFSYVIVFAKNNAAPNISVHRIIYIAPIIIKGLYLTSGLASIFLLMTFKYTTFLRQPIKLMKKNAKPYFLVFMFWITPSLLFNIFVRSDHAAHQMAYLSALVLLCSFCISKVAGKKALIVVLVIVSLNLFTFFRERDVLKVMPYVSQSFHYSELVKNNIRMKSISEFINTKFSKENTIVIIDPEIFRQSSYYLMDFNVFAYGALDTSLPPHKDIVHRSYGGHYTLRYDKSHELTISSKVTEIVVINNNKEIRLPKGRVTKHILKGNAIIYSIRVLAGEKYLLSVHQIERIIR